MSTWKHLCRVWGALCQSEAGATAIEYALIATLISVFLIGSYTAVGSGISGSFYTALAALPLR